MSESRVERIREILRPDADVEFRGGTVYAGEHAGKARVEDDLDRIKHGTKSHPRLYYLVTAVVAPLLDYASRVRRVIDGMEPVVLNLGSGNRRLDAEVVNVDLFDYANVDVVSDIHELPFEAASVGGVVNIAVLEHVREPEKIVAEMHRVLRPGGRVYSVVPFLQPFHASPHDYQRYTLPGLRQLHRDFEEIDSGVFDGPVAGLLWVAQESVAAMLSFGSPRARNLIAMALMLLTWPVKVLDVLFRRTRAAESCASTFFFHGRKIADPAAGRSDV